MLARLVEWVGVTGSQISIHNSINVGYGYQKLRGLPSRLVSL